MNSNWPGFFLQGCDLDIHHLFDQAVPDSEDLKQFQCDGAWTLGRRMRDDTPGMHSIMVLRLIVNRRANLVAKTFFQEEYFQSIKQLDPFLDESRAYEHILRNCPPSKSSYFPLYYGVILDLKRDKYPMSYALRPRAIVLERVTPDIRSRRVLGRCPRPEYDSFGDFIARLEDLPLSGFEKEWYISLTISRLRRLTALHEIGILHRDVCDEHFRLPNDFYDTVLYDFSHAYTVNSPWPYVQRPKPLAELIRIEQNEVLSSVFVRAMRSELRTYLAATLNLDLAAVGETCSQELEDTKDHLELIFLRTRHRPDTFTHPSLASIFPFLESVRPRNSPAWHITRAQLLREYDSVWFCYTPGSDQQVQLVSCSGVERRQLDVDERTRKSYLLALVPRTWGLEESDPRLFTCARLVAKKERGPIVERDALEQLTAGFM